MPHPVQQKIAAFAGRVWRLRTMYAAGLWLMFSVTTLVALGMADYVLRFEDPGLRYLSSATVVLVLMGVFWRVLFPALMHRPSGLETAQRIEQHFPELNNGLSSSLAFLAQSATAREAGSVDLRRAVVAGVSSELDRLDFGRCLDTRKPWRVMGLAIAVCLITAAVCIWQWPVAGLAARRLAMPWKQQPWPRRNQLQFVQPPTRIAVGSDFEVELVDRNGNLPQSIQILYWFDGEDRESILQKEMKYFDGRMVDRLENVRRSFRYRASGGDDDAMPWNAVQVVEPPGVDSVSIRLHPPAYTGWPVEPSGGNIHALHGTVVALTGRLNAPAASVTLRTDGEDPSPAVPIQISPDGLGFQIRADANSPWVVTESGEYWFEVTDPAGLTGTGGPRWSIRAVQDEPPQVVLEKPAANSFVTPDALLTLQGVVKDDLAIRSIQVHYRRGDAGQDTPLQTVPVFQGPNRLEPADSPIGLGNVTEHLHPVDYPWDLAQLPELEPGLWIDFELVAEDYRPQQQRSARRRLTIISASELEERIAARRSFLLGQLAEVLRVQREVRSQTGALGISWEEQALLQQQDIDRLQSAELRQRQVSQLLIDPPNGVQAQIRMLLDELQSNRVESPEEYQRMNDLLDAVQRISRKQLPNIQRELINLTKAARERFSGDANRSQADPVPVDPSLVASLQSAGSQQDDVIAALESLLGDFSQWDNYRRFSRELARLRQAQQEVRQATEQLRLENLARELRELTPEQRTTLRRVGQRQTELAREFLRIQSRMEQMQAELLRDEPATAETLADALDVARRNAIGGQMRDCSRRIDDNQLGDAAGVQQAVLNHLQELIDTLVNRREHQLDRRLDKLRAAEADVQELRRQQQELEVRFRQALGADPEQQRRDLEQLQVAQEDVAERADRLSRRLERLRTEQAAASLTRAAAQAGRGATAAEQGRAEDGVEQARQAGESLEDAERQLREERRRAEQDLAQAQITRLAQVLRDLAKRQQSLADTTVQYEQLRDEQGQWTRAQSLRVGRLAREQRLLAEETGGLAERVTSAEVFVLGLQGIVREMDRAARGLERAETGAATQAAHQAALARLAQFLEALEQEPKVDDQPPGDGGPPGDPSLAAALRKLTELKLLRLMQQQVNRQTSELERLRQTQGALNDEQLEQLNALSREQGQLAELILNLAS